MLYKLIVVGSYGHKIGQMNTLFVVPLRVINYGCGGDIKLVIVERGSVQYGVQRSGGRARKNRLHNILSVQRCVSLLLTLGTSPDHTLHWFLLFLPLKTKRERII